MPLMDMDRRGFLRMMGMAGVVAAMPEFVLSSPGIVVPDRPIELSLLREVFSRVFVPTEFREDMGVKEGSDSTWKCHITAYNEKLMSWEWVDFWIDPQDPMGSYVERRRFAEPVLRKSLIHKQWDVRDMRPPRAIKGYSPPEWWVPS